MAGRASISVSNSSVYQGLFHQTGSVDKLLSEQEHSEHGGAVFNSTRKPTFLHRLLEIEKAHDRKKVEKLPAHQKQRLSYSKTTACEDVSDAMLGSRRRRMKAQVLEDASGEATTAESPSKNLERLPPIHNSSSSRQQQPQRRFSMKVDMPSLPELSETSKKTGKSGTDTAKPSETLNPWNEQAEPKPRPSLLDTGRVTSRDRKRRHLRLPPILLPRVYTLAPRPLRYRQFLTPTQIRGPITDEEWEELKRCRYLRHAVPAFTVHLAPFD